MPTRRTLAFAAVSCIAISACDSNSSSNSSKSATDTTKGAPAVSATSGGADLTGAGATFPQPIYAKWFAEYAAKTGVKINYQAIGSGGGVRQLSEQTVDFGASDAPMSDSEMAKAKGGAIMHVPTVIGVVALAYNVPGLTQRLKVNGPVVADIFLGKITRWNDPRIASLNSGVNLPASDILVVHRTDGSGTTYIFTDFLSSVSTDWRSGPGKGKDIQWPVGLGAAQNAGVAASIKSTPGALGYIELAYAKQNNLSTALIRNAAGQFVAPSADGATAAVATLPANTDYRVSIVNSAGAQAYPIASFTWLILYRHEPDAAKAKKLTDFIRWALTDGEQEASSLDYAPLPAALRTALVARLDSVTAGAAK